MSISKISSLAALALAFTVLTSTARASISSSDQPTSQAGAQWTLASDHHRPAPHHRPKPPHPKPAPGG